MPIKNYELPSQPKMKNSGIRKKNKSLNAPIPTEAPATSMGGAKITRKGAIPKATTKSKLNNATSKVSAKKSTTHKFSTKPMEGAKKKWMKISGKWKQVYVK